MFRVREVSVKNRVDGGTATPSINSLSGLGHSSARRAFLRTAVRAPLAVRALGARAFTRAEEAPAAQTEATGRLNYHPEGLYFWDSWYFTRGEEVHVIHLQKKRPGSTRPDRDDGALGHAVSTDLLTWKELPPALYRGPEGSIDDMDLFTGWTIEHEGTYYLYYTARSQREKGLLQRLCLATSEDTIHWRKRPEPVIVPDPRWYIAEDCRDIVIQRHPETGEFHGFYAAARARKELVERSVIAHVRSRDLIHWTHEPPAFVPSGHSVVECPDVFFLDGRWWMTCNAGHLYGARARFGDLYVTWGTIYASAERLEGPYREGEDNVLIGSMEFNGFCCRSVIWKGQRYLFYGQGERLNRQDRGDDTTGTLTTPKELRVSPEGALQPVYSPLIEQRTGAELIAGPTPARLEELVGRFGTPGEWRVESCRVRSVSPKSWSVRLCGPEAESFIWTAALRLKRGRAVGLLFRQVLAVFLDFEEQSVMFTHLWRLQRLDARRVRLVHGRPYRLRMIAKGEFFEVYLDDVLVLNFVRYEPPKGRLGLFIEAGDGTFSNVRAVSLKV